ncbi:MAG: hypothetical protein OEY85_01960 [Rhodospirillales bacterium]|nr:hypothetical protein [Rhodospirillales bacterium]
MAVIYRPVRLHGQESINTYRCLPVSEQDASLIGKRTLLNGKNVSAVAERNCSVLREAFADLESAHRKGNGTRLIVPINARALLETETSTQLVLTLKQIDKSLQKAAIPEVFDFPQNLSMGALETITIPLLPFFDYYMAMPSPDTQNLVNFSNINYFGVSLDLEALDCPPEKMNGVITDFWAAATKRKLKLYIQGINDQEIEKIAQRYEVFAMDGPFIMKDSQFLGGEPEINPDYN